MTKGRSPTPTKPSKPSSRPNNPSPYTYFAPQTKQIEKFASQVPAEHFTNKANTLKKKRQWDHVYTSAKKRGASPASAVKMANASLQHLAKNRLKKKYGRD